MKNSTQRKQEHTHVKRQKDKGFLVEIKATCG